MTLIPKQDIKIPDDCVYAIVISHIPRFSKGKRKLRFNLASRGSTWGVRRHHSGLPIYDLSFPRRWDSTVILIIR